MHTHDVYVLTINNRDGGITLPYTTEAAAKQAAYDYVKAWWSELLENDDEAPKEAPEDQDEAIEIYFDSANDWEDHREDYEIERFSLEFEE